LSLPQEN